MSNQGTFHQVIKTLKNMGGWSSSEMYLISFLGYSWKLILLWSKGNENYPFTQKQADNDVLDFTWKTNQPHPVSMCVVSMRLSLLKFNPRKIFFLESHLLHHLELQSGMQPYLQIGLVFSRYSFEVHLIRQAHLHHFGHTHICSWEDTWNFLFAIMNRLKYVHRFPKANLSRAEQLQDEWSQELWLVKLLLLFFNKQKDGQLNKSDINGFCYPEKKLVLLTTCKTRRRPDIKIEQ